MSETTGQQDKFETVDAYIESFPQEKREVLEKVRETIHRAALEAVEKISWQMPTYYLKGNLIHFAMHKNHLGVYPSPEALQHFADSIKEYKTTKGAIQFPLNKPIPYELIFKMAEYRVQQVTGGQSNV